MSTRTLISIIVPVYNEEATIEDCMAKILNARLPDGCDREVVVVDDCSKDNTAQVLRRMAAQEPRIRLSFHEVNQGKGAAVRDALRNSTGDICLIQDADLEYDPSDYPRLLEPILSGDADVVYGSRFLPSERKRVLYFWHSMGNKFLTLLSNFFTDLNLTDMETGYKVARGDLFRSIPIRSARFGLEPEITAKFSKRGCRIYEVPIVYRGRSYEEGKKITWKDGVSALFTILRFKIVDDLYETRGGPAVLARLTGTRRFNQWIAMKLRPFVGPRVLEIGAGIGNLTRFFLPREHYLATDPDEQNCHYLKNLLDGRPRVSTARLDVTRDGDLQSLAESFDTVICLNELEHLEDDTAALRRMRGTLQPGGRLCLLVPNGVSQFGALDRMLGRLRRYNKRILKEKLESAGFEVEIMFGFNRITAPIWFWNSRILRRRTFSRVGLKVFDQWVWLWRALDHLLPWPGVSLMAIARKPSA